MTSSNIDSTTGHSREIRKIPNRKKGFLLQFLVNHQKKILSGESSTLHKGKNI